VELEIDAELDTELEPAQDEDDFVAELVEDDVAEYDGAELVDVDVEDDDEDGGGGGGAELDEVEREDVELPPPIRRQREVSVAGTATKKAESTKIKSERILEKSWI
jgi:hypothetical protein